MPKMDGVTASREIRYIKPGVKVILCSGYSEEEICGSHEQAGLAGFLHKPYSLDKLRSKLEQVLGRESVPRIETQSN